MATAAPKSTVIEVRATFAERPQELSHITAYAFSGGGALLDMQPLDDKKPARLSVPGSKEAQAIRLLVGPAVDKEQANAAEILRRGAVERHVALREGVDLPAQVFELEPEVLRTWIGRLCVVRGTLLKRTLSGGLTLNLPVCNATIDIHEVDPWFIIIPRLPDLDLGKLREVVDGPWPPVRWPVPPPPPELEQELLSAIPSVLDQAALNPQPLPPKALNPGVIAGLDLQAAPLRMLSRQLPEPAASTVMPAALRTAARGSRALFERAIFDHLDLLRPILCWLYPRFVRKTRIATVVTDDCGHFRTIIWRSIFNTDQPDLYFVARQRFWPGFWVTIYDPLPVGCHTYWNYACGTEVTLVTANPWARSCKPCPPVVAPNNWVLFMAIGNTSVWRIHGANDATRVGAPGHVPDKYGLLDNAMPWGGTLRPRLEFDNSLRDTLGLKYYRVSFKRPTEADTEWRPSTEAINRHYTHEVGGDLVLEQYALGPGTHGGTPNLYEIPPALPPTGQWSIPNAVLDTQSAVFDTAAAAPGTTFDDAGTPLGAGQGGLWQIKVELFNAAGNPIDPEALGIKWRVPESADLTGTIATEDALGLGLVDTIRNCMIVTVRIDNNRCFARVDAPTLEGGISADGCGVMRYTSRSLGIATPFLALQRNGFATYSFYVQRGDVWPPEVTQSGPAATSVATMPAPVPTTVENLLDEDCDIAGLLEHLYVAHTGTDGWSRMSAYDAPATRAFVLAATSAP